MPNTKKSNFFKTLTRDNSKVQKERAERLETITKSEAESLVKELETKQIQLEDKLEAMMDVTTSNDLTSANAIQEWDGKEFIRERVKIRMELKNLKINLEAAREEEEYLFG